MGILGSLLPGFRELRAPLAAGYLWLLLGWIPLHDRIPPENTATGLWDVLYDLGDNVSVLGIGVAASFVAYLLGSVSGACFDQLLARPGRWHTFLATRRGHRLIYLFCETAVIPRLSVTGETLSRLMQGAEVEMRTAAPRTTRFAEYWVRPGGSILRESLARAVRGDFDLIERRLIGEHPELYSEADRLGAEARFRFAIIPPLMVLSVLLAARYSWTWAFLLLPIAVLFVQGLARHRERGDLLVDALVLGRVQAPTIERLGVLAQTVSGEDTKGGQLGTSTV